MKKQDIDKREQIINKICKEKNWDINNLSPQQKLFIAKLF